jgi:hypothetical protein
VVCDTKSTLLLSFEWLITASALVLDVAEMNSQKIFGDF